jgi:type II secretory pathway pseudopilin PulG
MTMIELGIVMGIVSILMALVLGLSRHVNTVMKIRRAQADLGEWHETLNRWHLQFGEYPHARIDTDADSVDPLDPVDWKLTTPSRYPLTILTNQCEIIMPLSGNATTSITFRSFLTTAVSTVDPWGMPYIYIPSENAQSYTLFSCGPNRKSADIPQGTAATPDPTLDDIYFER